MKTIFTLCAQGSCVDTTTNTLSVFDVLEEMIPQGYPVWIPKIVFIGMIERDMKEPSVVKARLVARLDGKEIMASEVSLDFVGRPRHRLIATIQGLPIGGPGTATFALEGSGIPDNSYCITFNPAPVHISPDAGPAHEK